MVRQDLEERVREPGFREEFDWKTFGKCLIPGPKGDRAIVREVFEKNPHVGNDGYFLSGVMFTMKYSAYAIALYGLYESCSYIFN
ncbi:hypothetical protein J4460_06400 [Candidatus Woesearchaeota archaeon]|nr:MAG: hypothetical protein QS99_C0010G0041 [archaeon GW2011_AR4]MBS3130274.1 hypothetical protein [Candidatus Woesearchaeota archaeon]HIH38205.1 hypothetical protein [Candidatus Woesearchaeota archaeon]HIH49499.1 hypothetical protein [Candidatus Woesearchaeota archaeon]HIJ03882.1 hypothetical protein [Candidatus Woesearchaeota archaeon]